MSRRVLLTVTVAGLSFGLGAPARAASPDAWAALFARASQACAKASGLNGATAGPPIDFQDKVLVTVEGRWPQPHMNNAPASFACLYDKRSHKAQAREATR